MEERNQTERYGQAVRTDSIMTAAEETGNTDRLVCPGITLRRLTAPAQPFVLPFLAQPDMLVVTHCEEGRIEYYMKNNLHLYVKKGIASIGCCYEYGYAGAAFIPSLEYEGLIILIHLPELDRAADTPLNRAINSLTVSESKGFYRRGGLGRVIDENLVLQQLFSELYHLPEDDFQKQAGLKITEILQLLASMEGKNRERYSFLSQQQVDVIKRIQTLLRQNLASTITIKELAQRSGMSETAFKLSFQEITGQTAYKFRQECRIKKAIELLLDTNLQIRKISSIVGYKNSSKFSHVFQLYTGMTPFRYRQLKKRLVLPDIKESRYE